MKKKSKFNFLILVMVGTIFSTFIISLSDVKIAAGKGFGCNIYTSRDSILILNRHMGYINYDRFIELVKEEIPNTSILDKGDSIYVSSSNQHYFFGQDETWTRQYINLPVKIMKDGFCAKVLDADTAKYILLPYQILANIAKVGTGKIVSDNFSDEIPRHTFTRQTGLSKESLVQGKKIQTEGVVRQNVNDILSHHLGIDKREQLEALWKHAKNNWNYVNDPEGTIDTWRPASETINDYYFVSGRCYSGDCDDFAILMASFARQIGYKSRFIGAVNDNGEGHAYAEFLDGNKWISLDWFSNQFGGKPFEGHIIINREDL